MDIVLDAVRRRAATGGLPLPAVLTWFSAAHGERLSQRYASLVEPIDAERGPSRGISGYVHFPPGIISRYVRVDKTFFADIEGAIFSPIDSDNMAAGAAIKSVGNSLLAFEADEVRLRAIIFLFYLSDHLLTSSFLLSVMGYPKL